MSTEMDDYDHVMSTLKARIRERRELRDGQQDGDDEYRRYQQQATQASVELGEWEQVVGRLRELDGQIAALESQSRGMQFREDEKRASVSRAAMFCGAGAAVGLLVGVAFSMGWVWWLVTVLLLAGAVAAGVQSTRLQLNAPVELRENTEQQQRLRSERKRLMPASEN